MGARRVVRIDVERDVEPLGARRLDHGEHLRGLAPARGADRLQVRDLRPGLRLSSDLYGLSQRREYAYAVVALVADMRGVERSLSGDGLGERGHFARLGEGARG